MKMMIHKLAHIGEGYGFLLAIQWQPIFGTLLSIAGIVFYISMTKVNIVDVKYNGSWKNYFKSILKYFKKSKDVGQNK